MPRTMHEAPIPSRDTPRILCLHGGGSSAKIFQTQCRVLIRHLNPRFHLVFADGPVLSKAGPDIMPTYADMGPYRSWLLSNGDCPVSDMLHQLARAMAEDDHEGWQGQWVGFLGFSQGAKIAASLLLEVQRRRTRDRSTVGGGISTVWNHDWRFSVVLAGRAPMVGFYTGNSPPDHDILSLPTLHLHGLQDPGLELHRQLYEKYCDPKSRRLLEWEGSHRIPIKEADAVRLRHAIEALAVETGVVI